MPTGHDSAGQPPEDFALFCNEETGFACFYNRHLQLLRWRHGAAWEYQHITQRGRYRGLAIFVRFLRDEEGRRLELALHTELARRRLATRGLDAALILELRGWHLDVCSGRLVT